MKFIELKVRWSFTNTKYHPYLRVGGVASKPTRLLMSTMKRITDQKGKKADHVNHDDEGMAETIAPLLQSMKKLYDKLEQVASPPPSPSKKTTATVKPKKEDKEEEEEEEKEVAAENTSITLKLQTSEEKELLQLCKSIIEKRCGILNKVDEKILALEHAHRGWQHVSDGYGADLVDPVTGARVEVKTSTVSKGKIGTANYQKTNWNFKLNWKIPSKGRVSFKEVYVHWAKKLLGEDSNSGVDSKATAGGDTPLSSPTKKKNKGSPDAIAAAAAVAATATTPIIMSEVEAFEKDYKWWRLLKISKTLLKADMFPKPSIEIEVSDPVMALILTCLTINNGGSMNANLGSSRCKNCGKYHRIDNYIQNVYKNVGDPLIFDSFSDFLLSINVDRPTEVVGEDEVPSIITDFSPSAYDLSKLIISKSVTNCKDV